MLAESSCSESLWHGSSCVELRAIRAVPERARGGGTWRHTYAKLADAAPASKVARCVLSGCESVPAGPAIAALAARNGCTASALSAIYQSGWSQIVPRGCREVTGCEIWAARCVQPHRNPARAALSTPEFSQASPPTAHPFHRLPLTFDAFCYTQMGLLDGADQPVRPDQVRRQVLRV